MGENIDVLKKILIPLMLLLLISPQAQATDELDLYTVLGKSPVEKVITAKYEFLVGSQVNYHIKKIVSTGPQIHDMKLDFILDGKIQYTAQLPKGGTVVVNKTITFDSINYNVNGNNWNNPRQAKIILGDPPPKTQYSIFDVKHDSVTVKIDGDLIAPKYLVYLDDKVVTTLINQDTYKISNLKANTDYKINVVAVIDDIKGLDNIKSVTTKDPPPPPKLQQEHVRAQNITDKSAELYVAALIPNYDHIYIYDKDDKLIHQQPITGMVAYRHQLKDLQQDRSYKYFVQVKHGSVLSDKLQIAFKTPRTETEVGNLQGRNEGESVVLSWINPDYDDFKWVKIYRKKEDEPAPKAKFFGFGMMTASAAAGYNPMFKFDGQNWQDLTVEAATTYEYKVTTLDVNESNETDGKTVKVKTLPPKIGGSELTGGEDKKNPDGTPELDGDGNPIKEDFIIKWSTPTKGKVKVMVGGQEYTTVPASQQQVTIPYSDMQYDGLGNPQVQLIPIADNGTTGQTAQPPPPSGGTIGNVVGSGASAAVNANNLLQISLGLLAKVALFILLGMAFMLVPKLIRIIYYAVTGKDSYMENNNEENKKVRVIEKRR